MHVHKWKLFPSESAFCISTRHSSDVKIHPIKLQDHFCIILSLQYLFYLYQCSHIYLLINNFALYIYSALMYRYEIVANKLLLHTNMIINLKNNLFSYSSSSYLILYMQLFSIFSNLLTVHCSYILKKAEWENNKQVS